MAQIHCSRNLITQIKQKKWNKEKNHCTCEGKIKGRAQTLKIRNVK